MSDGTAEVLRLGGPDLAPLLAADGDGDALRQVEASLPAVFVTSVALARQWMAWGVQPDVLLGHSLGEYVAAHLAGVMSFEDALSLVVGRSRLIAPGQWHQRRHARRTARPRTTCVPCCRRGCRCRSSTPPTSASSAARPT